MNCIHSGYFIETFKREPHDDDNTINWMDFACHNKLRDAFNKIRKYL